MVQDLVTLIMAMSKCRECGKAVSTLAKTCPHCGVPKPVKKIKKILKKKNSIKKMKICCFSSGCQNMLKPVSVNHSTDLSKFYCSRCGGGMKKYSAKEALDNMQRVKDLQDKNLKRLERAAMYKKLHDENETEINRLRKNMKSKTYTPSSSTSAPSSSSTNYKSSSNEKSAYDKFADGNLDLATAFWLFGILGSFAGSLILTLLAESVSKIFYFPFVGLNAFIIIALWECAENYKKEELQKKQSAVWGYLTQVFCVVGGLGLVSTVYDIIKTL
jgi:hypothetical protein